MPTARERLAAEEFSTSAREIEHRLSLADEMRIVLEMEHDFSKEDYPDIQPVLAKLRIEGAFLDVVEVVLLRQALAEIGGGRRVPARPQGALPCLVRSHARHRALSRNRARHRPARRFVRRNAR